MQKPKRQIKHDNLVAHISILKEELSSVSKKLNQKTKERKLMEKDLSSAKKLLQKIKEEYAVETEKMITVFKEQNNKEQALNQRINTITEKELALIDKIKVDEKKEKERKRLEVKNNVLSNRIEKNELLLQIKQKKIDIYLDKILKDTISQTKTTIKLKDSKKEELKELDREMEEKISVFNHKIQSKKLELTNLTKLVSLEQGKIKEPLFLLQQEHKNLERRKKNFDVMVMRFNKTFKAKYPNIQLKV